MPQSIELRAWVTWPRHYSCVLTLSHVSWSLSWPLSSDAFFSVIQIVMNNLRTIKTVSAQSTW